MGVQAEQAEQVEQTLFRLFRLFRLLPHRAVARLEWMRRQIGAPPRTQRAPRLWTRGLAQSRILVPPDPRPAREGPDESVAKGFDDGGEHDRPCDCGEGVVGLEGLRRQTHSSDGPSSRSFPQ